jgi:hypothetical protein
MAIPRRLIVLAVSAAAAGAVLYVSQRMKKAQERDDKKSPVDEANEKKDAAAEKKADDKKADEKRAEDASSSTASSSSSTASASTASTASTAQKELALFLAGDAWHDEIGWQALWEKESINDAGAWLKGAGKEVLVAERKKLVEHPALLAGCRRRWIVVCRYAGIDVGDAASIWTSTEVTV